ncbi:MAG: hypothetical protein ACYTF1_02205 [Planctomycetota bacterium]|jgi:hypothetical protein
MVNRKHSDARRFDFCTRCLLPAGPNRSLIEHHVFGRKKDHTAIVFICHDCNQHVENNSGPIVVESRVLSLKRDLLIQSRALRWVVKNWEPIVDGFIKGNRNGVGTALAPGSGGWLPPFGAKGLSGRKYYFIPPDHLDEFVEVPTSPTWTEDGIGGPASNANWVRFKGTEQNILNKFLDAHKNQGSPGVDLDMLRQN